MYITVRHSSADTVAKVINEVNGKCRFGGLSAPIPSDKFSKKFVLFKFTEKY